MTTQFQKLEEVFLAHFGPQYSNDDDIKFDVRLFFAGVNFDNVNGSPAIDSIAEGKKLDRLKAAVDELVGAWSDLHVSTRLEATDASMRVDWRRTGMRYPPALSAIRALPEVLRAALDGENGVRARLSELPERGRGKIRNVAAVRGAREVWYKRTGKWPPRHPKVTDPFHDFLAAVLAAIGGGNPRSAARAWREHNPDPNRR